jgi:NhaP-type Na+/H+ or K+/H+ antiporter
VTAHSSTGLAAAVLFAVLVLGFTAVAAALGRRLITAPAAFVVIGAVLGFTIGPMEGSATESVKTVAEITLVLILFHDAAEVRPREISSDRGFYARLLLLGFPLTILLGYLLARVLFPDLPVMMALLLAAALAPTDAGLGAPTVLNPVVPTRIRRALNVESGLNDGLATPIVLFAIAVIAGEEGLAPRESLVDALVELALGVVSGFVVGGAGGALLGWSRQRGLSTAASRTLGVLMVPLLAYGTALLLSGNGFVVGGAGGALLGWSRQRGLSTAASRTLGVLMVPLLAYGTALMLSGNGFVAAFISGTAFAGSAAWIHDEETALLGTEEFSDLLGYAVWLVLGLVAVPLAWRVAGWRELLFAVLALTLVRMLPVALCLLGTRLRPQTVAFLGWFGPRGLASVVFALIALESLEVDQDLRIVLATISLTVLLSVVAHGFSAQPLATRYGAWVARATPPAELAELNRGVEPRPRGARLWR